MNYSLLKHIICPDCGSSDLEVRSYDGEGEDAVEDGILRCNGCDDWFRIENGILDLLPSDLRRWDLHEAFARKHGLTAERTDQQGEKEKKDQISFFLSDSVEYESEIAENPCFLALDDVTVGEWLKHRLTEQCRILDLGCGTGRQIVRMASHGHTVVGVDISEEMLNIAAGNVRAGGVSKRVDLVVADAERLPLKDESFHASTVIGALHHVPNPDRVVQELCRAVRGGGAILVYDPHKSPVRFIFDMTMRIWKLYDEQASEDPLMTEQGMTQWMSTGGADCTTRLSVFLPPHLFLLLGHQWSTPLLRITDRVLNAIPVLRKCGGILVTEAVKNRS